jgi:hypothetical protein
VTEQHHLAGIDVQQLAPQGSGEILLTPQTRVLCIHRGRNPTENGALINLSPRRRDDRLHPERRKGVVYDGDYADTYDGHHYIIPPGYFEVELGAALHFKDRAVVPGSRNPETNYQASFIAVVGVVAPTPQGYRVLKPIDDPDQWPPFTDEECQAYEIAFEAIDRGSMVNPIDADVQVVETSGRLHGGADRRPSRVSGGGGSGRSSGRGARRPQIEATDETILQPVPEGQNSWRAESRVDAAARAAGRDA